MGRMGNTIRGSGMASLGVVVVTTGLDFLTDLMKLLLLFMRYLISSSVEGRPMSSLR